MSYAASPYRKGISRGVKVTLLFVILILQYFISGLNGNIGERVISYFGLDSNKVSFFLHLGTVGMLAVVPVAYRFRSYFKRINLLMWSLAIQLLVSVWCYCSDNELVLMLSSFVMGAVKVIVLLDLLSLFVGVFPILMSKGRGVFYGILYGVLRSIREVSTVVFLELLKLGDWKVVFLVSIFAVVITIIICLYLFEPRRTTRKIPLYQVEWISMGLMIVMGVTLCFALIMGKELDWWASREIRIATIAFLLSTSCFIYRQANLKRPYWDLKLFYKYKQIALGAILMIVMYIYYSTSVLFNLYIDYNFKGVENYLIQFGGVVLGCYLIFFPIVGMMIYKNISRRLMISLGFLCFAGSLLYFSSIIQAHLSFWDLIPSIILSAAGYALLLTNSAAYLATNIARQDNTSRIMVTLSMRYVLGSFIASALFGNWIYRQIRLHITYLSEHLNFTNATFMQALQQYTGLFEQHGAGQGQARLKALGMLHQQMAGNALLISIREISFLVGGVAIALGVVVLFIRRFELHKEEGKNKYKLTPW